MTVPDLIDSTFFLLYPHDNTEDWILKYNRLVGMQLDYLERIKELEGNLKKERERMKYLQEGIGEISQAEFEEILGPNIVVGPSSGATVTALEASRAETHMSCIVYLDQEPPLWLRVLRKDGGYLLINDW